jgi:hypothetical protein
MYIAHIAETVFLNFQGAQKSIPSTSLCSLAARSYNPIPTRFLARIDCYKIPALVSQSSLVRGKHGLEKLFVTQVRDVNA